MKIEAILIILLMLGCARTYTVLDESRSYTYELEMKGEEDDPVLYLYLENLSSDTLLLMSHSLYCGTMPLYIFTLDNMVVGRLGFGADCSPEKVLPNSKNVATISLYESINAGISTRHYNFNKGSSYKIKLDGRNDVTSNEITFTYNPHKIEKPVLGKFESRYTPKGYQLYANMYDEDISMDRVYLGTYKSLDYLSRNQMKSKGIFTEKNDSLFRINIPNKFVDQILVYNNIERTEMFFVTLYFENLDKHFNAYFFPKKKDD